jgi:hypothetical protein
VAPSKPLETSMVKLVSNILRNVGGRTIKPGEEFEVDDRTGRRSGRKRPGRG